MKLRIWPLLLTCFLLASCDDKDDSCGNGVKDSNEDCDGNDFGGMTCAGLDIGMDLGTLACSSSCKLDLSGCHEPSCNNDGIKDADEECDGEDFGGLTCADLDDVLAYGRLGCTRQCRISKRFCFRADVGLQAPIPDAESTDAQCSNGKNDFHTVNKNGTESSWFDCNNNQCNHSPLVQYCKGTENSDATCSDGVDNANGKNLHANFKNRPNGLIDCADPSCYKNWRVTVCENEAPRWELGADCSDGVDNDGDGLKDCEDPDCLHANISDCDLGGRARVLFDNAHHEIAGAVDWVIDITGRHPYPSKPAVETDWHGSLSGFGKDLLDSGNYIVETLPQDRMLTFGEQKPQDLSAYDILVIPEPSSEFELSEAEAVYNFVKNGGGLMIIVDHWGADRDGNGVDSVMAINNMLAIMPNSMDVGVTSADNNLFGFYVLGGSYESNSTTKVAEGAENHEIIKGAAGEVRSTGLYGAAEFDIFDSSKAKAILTEKSSNVPFMIAAEYEKGRIVAIGDSAIIGDGTNYLGLTLTTENCYIDNSLDNRVLLLNAMDWLRKK